MRNWTQTLRGASFRGVPFRVDDEALPKTGRRVAVHEYSKAEEHGTEDMGRLPREFRVKAYIHGDSADSAIQDLIAACSTAGAATLVLPFFGANQVRCTGCSPSHGRDKLGWVTVDLDFVEATLPTPSARGGMRASRRSSPGRRRRRSGHGRSGRRRARAPRRTSAACRRRARGRAAA